MGIERAIDVKSSPSGLRPAEEELNPFFALSQDLSCVVALDGRFERVNPAWEACLGWTHEDLLLRSFLDFVHPDDRADTAAQMGKVAAGSATIGFENRFQGKDGADRRLQWNAVFSPQRRVICASARDITGQKRLERELIEAGDREREPIGRELHDGLCQNLAGTAALSATLARKLAACDDPAAAAAANLTVLMQQAVGDARDLARGLNPAGLAQMGLAMALEALAANVRALHPATCAFACGLRFPRLDPAVEAHLYRIAQEAVSNAVAHGRGKRIDISLRIRNGQGSLRIRDNGVGIPQSAGAVEGVGLHGMDYRARMISASLRVQRVAPHGTMVACEFPLSSSPPRERRHAGNPLERTLGKKAIIIADDHPLMRRGLTALIDSEPDLVVSGEAGACGTALQAIARRPPDLAIIDLSLEGGEDGLDLVKALKIRSPPIPSLVLSMHPEAIYAERALRAGARGYLSKQQLGETVLVAIRRVLSGRIYMSEALGMDLASRFVGGDRKPKSPLATLSDRELQVFRLIGEGRRTREIAPILNLSPKTIESYREHLKQKLDIDGAPELVRRAVRFVETGEIH